MYDLSVGYSLWERCTHIVTMPPHKHTQHLCIWTNYRSGCSDMWHLQVPQQNIDGHHPLSLWLEERAKIAIREALASTYFSVDFIYFMYFSVFNFHVFHSVFQMSYVFIWCPHHLSFSRSIICTVYRNITTHGQFIVLGVVFIVLYMSHLSFWMLYLSF